MNNEIWSQRLLCMAEVEADLSEVMIFRDLDGRLWARSPGKRVVVIYPSGPIEVDGGYRHKKSGGYYIAFKERVLLESDPEGPAYVLYMGIEDGRIWLRPEPEFFDGRFEEVGDEDEEEEVA